MIYLLDAHTFLWWARGSPALSKTASSILQNPQNRLAVSVASVWELSLKYSLGKLPDFQPFENSKILSQFLETQAIQLLPVALDDISLAATLPMHHKDPFDRIIIAQARRRQMTLLSKDEVFKRYAVKVVW